ncbi:COQ9 family protein [Thermaurantiacus sp.]
MTSDTPNDPTLDELAPRLAEALLPHVPFEGWSKAALAHAAQDLGIDQDVARLVFPGGAPDMIAAFIRLADARMLAACDTPAFRALKVRQKVTQAIRTRLTSFAPHREAIRRAASILSLPANVPLATRLTWGTADAIWRAAGDRATDFNHYSKRAIASAVYSATLFYWMGDESEDFSETWAFLDRRIDGVMQFEKLKARLKPADDSARPSLVRFLGRLRYPPAA